MDGSILLIHNNTVMSRYRAATAGPHQEPTTSIYPRIDAVITSSETKPLFEAFETHPNHRYICMLPFWFNFKFQNSASVRHDNGM